MVTDVEHRCSDICVLFSNFYIRVQAQLPPSNRGGSKTLFYSTIVFPKPSALPGFISYIAVVFTKHKSLRHLIAVEYFCRIN
jgi:hypothetical protein